MTNKRQQFRATSNNEQNTNKNVCGLAVAEALGVDEATRYLHTMNDLIRAARSRFTVRSRKSALKTKTMTVGSIRKKVVDLYNNEYCLGVIVQTDSHVLFLRGKTGETLVDTASRQRDSRKIISAYAVFPKM